MYREYGSDAALGNRSATFVAVVLFHILLAYAFYAGLNSRTLMHLATSFNVATIDVPKARVPPPIPRPQSIETPVVPTPEFPFLDPAGTDETIRNTSPPPEGSVAGTQPATPAPLITAVRMDPRHPLQIGREYYPDGAVRADQEGRCVLKMTVAADGRVREAAIQTSTGFALLDQACIDAVRGQRMIPATVDGKAVESSVSMPIVWRLSNR